MLWMSVQLIVRYLFVSLWNYFVRYVMFSNPYSTVTGIYVKRVRACGSLPNYVITFDFKIHNLLKSQSSILRTSWQLHREYGQ